MFRLASIWLVLAAALSCARHEPAREPPLEPAHGQAQPLAAASRKAPQSSSPSARLSPPSSSAGGLSELHVPGFLPALVYEPAANEPRPLLVATHGAGGAPEGDCAYWMRLTRGQVFVLCLRGTPFERTAPSSFYYKNHLELGRELVAALQAAHTAFGARLSPNAGLYAGFSQGATMGVGMIPPHGAELPHLVLIEGGYDYWSVARAKQYRASGGRRVLFACGTKWCADKSEKAALWLRQAGLDVRVEYAKGVGHTPLGGVMDRVAAALPWLVSASTAWQLE